MPVASVGGSRYFAAFLDDYIKLSVVVPLKQKSEVAKVTEHVINRLELQSGKQLKSVRTDRGKEYVNKALKNVFEGKGTVHQKTAPYSAEQNGLAERLNGDLEEKTRAMLEDSGLAKELWAKAVVTANYTRNRTPVSAHGRTPWELFFGEKPNVGHTRVFGARAFRHVPKQRRRKLDPRYPARKRRAPGKWYRANLAAEPKAGEHPKGTGEHPEPQTYQEAVGGEESELWRKSMDEEMRSLLENGTWELVERPEGVKPVPMKWVYKIKRDALGNVERYKSRLVAKGYLQKQGIDFEEVYAPMSNHTTLRALLAVVAERD
ncbi:protein with reverse transcriptase [Klebsormidium nitens]|uniref:Protein with reverse transcriptase n=1 Tax=Klebsormidium nitens TaxID=105231 RepID=A0A1Y1IRV4_KLENI|nr:protein with reverse transcriptase [Klebsormidium nitens]|eukprot:GAQ92752.1 protein with reverse transcriptase [Klebsormidium nitens]